MGKISKEKETVEQMIKIYCGKVHGIKDNLCCRCNELKDYAFQRLENCIFGEQKGSCGRCAVHCYKPAYREEIKKVMRFSGPRMILYNPGMALRHLFQVMRESRP